MYFLRYRNVELSIITPSCKHPLLTLIQETQLSLTNCTMHLCKCNDVADLTSIIKLCLKKFDSSHPTFQGHSRWLEPTRIDPPSMISN